MWKFLLLKTSNIFFSMALVTLAGCAGSPVALGKATPEQLAKENNYNLCRAAFSSHATAAIENEVKSRQINCAPYLAEEARIDANIHSLGRNQPVTTNCTTYGNNVNCRSY